MDEELMGVTEVSVFLGISRQRIHQLVKSPDFPQPVARLTAGLIWLGSDVEEWARRTGRLEDE